MGSPLRLSVGIPTRNQAEYLPATLDSLLNQRRRPNEIIVSDHASTDSTPEVLESYAQRYPGLIRIVRPPEGTNLTGQYNFTLASQTGDWITLLSSDDLALTNFCDVFEREAQRHPGAAVLRAPWQNVDSTGRVLGQEYLLSVPHEQATPDNLISQRYGPKVSFAAFAVRRTAFEESGPILPQMESLADWALFVQLAPFGPYVRAAEIVSSYRMGHDGNKFRNRFGMWVRDEQRMFGHVFPLAAERMGLPAGKAQDWIEEASRANFRRYLSAASKEFAPGERTPLLTDLRPWAASVGELSALSRFAAGERMNEPVRMSRILRQLLRPVVHRVAHTLARR